MPKGRDIKGITIEIGGDTTGLQNALKGVNTQIKTTQAQLKDINTLLKLDPTNTELLQQKQQALSGTIGSTKEKLETLKTAEKQVQQQFQEGKVSQEQYDALKREIIATEESLKSLENTVGSGSAKLAQISTVTGQVGENLTSAGKKMLPVTAAVTGIGTAAVKTAADFDSSMSNVAAISGASAEDMDKLRDRAREMGSQTKFSASEAGEAMGYMAMAGWDAQQMYNSLPGIMNLAAASGEDLAQTSDIVTDAMTAFGLAADGTTTVVKDGFSKEVDNATHFADVLAKASSSANTNVSMMGETFKYVAPVAGALGYSVEDTATAIGLMANSGIKASQAGTQLRSSLTNMIKPSKDVGDAMEKWGFYATETATKVDQAKIDKQMLRVQKATLAADKAQQTYNDAVSKYGSESTEASNAAASLEIKQSELANANETLTQLQQGTTENVRLYNKALQNEDGSMKSLKETMDFLRETMGGMTEAEQTQAATAIFGKEAMSGMLAIINASDADYQNLISNIEDADGAAEEMAETMQDNLLGQLTELKSALEELAIAFGKILMPYIRKIVTTIQDFVKKLNGMSEAQKKIIATIALIVAAIGPLLITIGKIATGISAITGAMSKFKNIEKVTGTIGSIKGALSGLFSTIAANPVAFAIVAIVTALVLLYTKCQWFHDAVNSIVQKIALFFTETIPQAWNSLMNFFSGAPEWWSGIWQQVFDFFTSAWTNMMQNPIISELVTMITKLWQNGAKTWQGIWQGLVTIAQGVWELLKNTILAPVILLIDLVTGDFEKLRTDASNIWTNIRNAAQTIWSGTKTVITSLAQGIKTGVTTCFSGLRNIANQIWEKIKTNVLNIAGNLKEKAIKAFEKMVSGISNALSGLGTVVKNGFQSAISFITSLPNKAWNWGMDFVNGIANGIRSAIGNVTSAVSDVANNIRSFLHFSVPDEGPLTDYESWMPDFVEGLAKGIENSRGIIQKAIQGLSGDLVVSADAANIPDTGTTINFYGNYKFEDKQDIDYFMNQAALKISRRR